jgi:hypothetical protein
MRNVKCSNEKWFLPLTQSKSCLFSGIGPRSVKKFYHRIGVLRFLIENDATSGTVSSIFPRRAQHEKSNYYADIIRKISEIPQHISSSPSMRSDVALFLLYQVNNEEVKDAA